MWLDGDRQRREIVVRQVPGRTDRGLKERRDGTSKGVAVCLCFPAIRETSRGRYTTKVRLSAFRLPLFSSREVFEPTIHAKAFAGSDDAWAEEGIAASL
jgi:hypothetical protein